MYYTKTVVSKSRQYKGPANVKLYATNHLLALKHYLVVPVFKFGKELMEEKVLIIFPFPFKSSSKCFQRCFFVSVCII